MWPTPSVSMVTFADMLQSMSFSDGAERMTYMEAKALGESWSGKGSLGAAWVGQMMGFPLDWF